MKKTNYDDGDFVRSKLFNYEPKRLNDYDLTKILSAEKILLKMSRSMSIDMLVRFGKICPIS